MKKYVVTAEHPEIKEGVILSWKDDVFENDYVSETKSIWLDNGEIKDQLKKGWIKEYKKEPKVKIVSVSYPDLKTITFRCVINDIYTHKDVLKAIKRHYKSEYGL